MSPSTAKHSNPEPFGIRPAEPADPPDPAEVVAGPAARTPSFHTRRVPRRELNKLPQINRYAKVKQVFAKTWEFLGIITLYAWVSENNPWDLYHQRVSPYCQKGFSK